MKKLHGYVRLKKSIHNVNENGPINATLTLLRIASRDTPYRTSHHIPEIVFM